MPKLNRTCFTCGAKYRYCPTCSDDTNKPTWHILFCNNRCKEIDRILSMHTANRLSDEDAFEGLIKLEVSASDVVSDLNKEHVTKILSYSKTNKKRIK